MTDFDSLLRVLKEAGVDFIIVGGVAAVAHGSARLTQDLDVVYSRDDVNIRCLAEALAGHSPYLRGAPDGLPFRWDIDTIHRGLNFTLTTDLGDLDHLATIGRLHGSWLRAVHLEREMRAPAVIIGEIAYERPLQMALTEHDYMV